ncbi:hypothetical protein GGX14DRAFT_586021 [Mycena pura]|uniref:SPT2 chromatin protein n=1 Tax=Mycena pura TaxID=153505 RepID=A0AAD6YIQ9_9AGAR|nr:hypothetical protein GGX14DRAFT_586021 [Mycena pura]
MATSYRALLALGDSHNKSADRVVAAALAQKKLREQQRRAQQEAQERKQRETEAALRLRHFAALKEREQAEAKAQAAREAKEAELRRREEEQRDALRYGPKKAAKMGAAAEAGGAGRWPSSSLGVRDDVRRRRLPDDEDGDFTTLTRQEKRERKLQAELKRSFHTPRKNGATGGYRKAGRRLPGGAVDVPTNSADAAAAAAASGSGGSVKNRLANMPNTLTRLNVVKRDTRTIDEIVRDRREQKEVLNGDRARSFDDWFTSASKKDTKQHPAADKAPVASSSASSSSSRLSSQRAPTPPVPTPPTKRASAVSSAVKPKPRMPAQVPSSASGNPKKRPRSQSLSRSVSPPLKRPHLSASMSTSTLKHKSTSRPRSPRSPPRAAPAASSFSEEIWGIFGKKKAEYMERDIDSEDDADMEADADLLEREEKFSERVARKEERLAEEEERRREEEKRRRKAAALGGRQRAS